MIFYFTGTGNSWYAAKKLLSPGEELISMSDCLKDKKLEFTIPEGESLGFAFPVYYGGLPAVVHQFLKKVRLHQTETYTYAVLTCGSTAGNAGGMLRDRLALIDIGLDAVYSVIMPENYSVMFPTPDQEKAAAIIQKADGKLSYIAESIAACRANPTQGNAMQKAMTASIYHLYQRGRKTDKFHVDDSCTGCGICVKRCPIGAIELVDGHPEWLKSRCVMCMACCRCNAVQFGNRLKDRNRYVNPDYKLYHRP